MRERAPIESGRRCLELFEVEPGGATAEASRSCANYPCWQAIMNNSGLGTPF